MLTYTTLSRRTQKLEAVPPASCGGELLHLVVDSTGLKLYGEGEWRYAIMGIRSAIAGGRCKVHLAMDAKTGQICAGLMTHRDVHDASALPDLLDQIPGDVPVEIGGDGAYDTKQAHVVIAARGAHPSISPREGAMSWPKNTALLQKSTVQAGVHPRS